MSERKALEAVQGDRAERCEMCRFWLQMWDGENAGVGGGYELDSTDEAWGYCRRSPPKMSPDHDDKDDYRCPKTSPDWWCGEWQPTSNTEGK